MNLIDIPPSVTDCRNVNCQSNHHRDEVDNLMEKVLGTVQEVAEHTLPFPKQGPNKKVKVLPGWNDTVKPLRDNAFFWHKVWQSAGRPLNTDLHRLMKKTRNIYHMQAKKCRKREEIIRKNKLLDACLNGNGNLFKEIKSMRQTKQIVATSIDGETANVPNHFKNIYSKLFNSVDDVENMAKVSHEITNRVSQNDIDDILKVTPEVVKQAAARLKPGKSDPVYSFSSDCVKVDSDRLAELLSIIFQSYLVHGHVTRFLLLATLVPIIKDKLGSINSSKNYRSIAISSLVLKLIDWVIIILFGETLGLNDLQFAYQPGISGNMCTYAILETIDYFLRNGGEIFACTMDMTKAFDVTMHSKLFLKMIHGNISSTSISGRTKGLSITFVRLLVFIYSEQFANVRWNGQLSSVFTMKNGVRQGAILSAIAYCFYVEDLFETLKKKRSGCWINGFFLGLFGYSDDNFALAPSINALRDMLKTISEYAEAHNLQFSTDPSPRKCKTKVMAFLKEPRALPNIHLGPAKLPWVDHCKHLGNNIKNVINGCQEDMKIKTARYVGKNIAISQEFHFSHPRTKIEVNKIWNTHFSGSPLWNLFSEGALKVESSYNKSVKYMMDLPFGTHRCLIEPLSGERHIKMILIKRFVSFMEKIDKSSKSALKMLKSEALKDVRSITGANYRGIRCLVGEMDIRKVSHLQAQVDNLQYRTVPEEDQWQLNITKELSDVMNGDVEVEGFDWKELKDIFHSFCIS